MVNISVDAVIRISWPAGDGSSEVYIVFLTSEYFWTVVRHRRRLPACVIHRGRVVNAVCHCVALFKEQVRLSP